MVKGTSRQVIVVHSPDKKLFDQAIFILKDDAINVTDEALLKEANLVMRGSSRTDRRSAVYFPGAFWACGGAMLTGLIWLITTMF